MFRFGKWRNNRKTPGHQHSKDVTNIEIVSQTSSPTLSHQHHCHPCPTSLVTKWKPNQRKLNWSQLKDKTFYRSNAVLGFFYIFTLLTTITCFARTVALQTGRWALLQGDPDSVPKIVLSKLAPNYMDEDMINTRSCLKTINHVNIPTPFNKSCLNDVEIGIESQLIKSVWLIKHESYKWPMKIQW